MRLALPFIVLTCVLPQWTFAQSADGNGPEHGGEEAAADRWHRQASLMVMETVERVDRFLVYGLLREEGSEVFDRFFGARGVEEEQKSQIRLSPRLSFKERGEIDADLEYGARIDFPRLEHRLQLIVDNIREGDEVDLPFLGQDPERDVDDGGTARLRYIFLENVNFRGSVDGGLSFRPEPDPRIQLRGVAVKNAEVWTTRASQSVFWRGDDGFGERTLLEFERWMREYFFRISTSALYSETSEGLEFAHGYAITHLVTKRRSIGLRASLSGRTEPNIVVETYQVRLPYRQRLHRDWIYLEIEPGADFPRDRDFSFTPRVDITVDLIIGADLLD